MFPITTSTLANSEEKSLSDNVNDKREEETTSAQTKTHSCLSDIHREVSGHSDTEKLGPLLNRKSIRQEQGSSAGTPVNSDSEVHCGGKRKPRQDKSSSLHIPKIISERGTDNENDKGFPSENNEMVDIKQEPLLEEGEATLQDEHWQEGYDEALLPVRLEDIKQEPVSESEELSLGAVSESDQLPLGAVSESDQLPLGPVSASDQLPLGAVSASDQLPLGAVSKSEELSSGEGSESDGLSSGEGSESDGLSSGEGSESEEPPSGEQEYFQPPPALQAPFEPEMPPNLPWNIPRPLAGAQWVQNQSYFISEQLGVKRTLDEGAEPQAKRGSYMPDQHELAMISNGYIEEPMLPYSLNNRIEPGASSSSTNHSSSLTFEMELFSLAKEKIGPFFIQFLEVAVSSVLLWRKILPSNFFVHWEFYGMSVTQPDVQNYINERLNTVKELFEQGILQCAAVVITTNSRPLERYVFRLLPATNFPDPLLAVTEETLQRYLLSLFPICKSSLPQLPENCSFHIDLTTTAQNSAAQAPFPWLKVESASGPIEGSFSIPISTLKTELLALEMYIQCYYGQCRITFQ